MLFILTHPKSFILLSLGGSSLLLFFYHVNVDVWMWGSHDMLGEYMFIYLRLQGRYHFHVLGCCKKRSMFCCVLWLMLWLNKVHFSSFSFLVIVSHYLFWVLFLSLSLPILVNCFMIMWFWFLFLILVSYVYA